MDIVRPEVGMSNAKVDFSRPVSFVVSVVVSLFVSFGFLIALQLFGQCWDLFGDWACVLQSLEVLWVDFDCW